MPKNQSYEFPLNNPSCFIFYIYIDLIFCILYTGPWNLIFLGRVWLFLSAKKVSLYDQAFQVWIVSWGRITSLYSKFGVVAQARSRCPSPAHTTASGSLGGPMGASSTIQIVARNCYNVTLHTEEHFTRFMHWDKRNNWMVVFIHIFIAHISNV